MTRYDLKLIHYFSAAGDYQSAEAFTALYDHTHLIVFRYIYALYGKPQEDVEDIWLETFLKAWRSRHRFTGSEDAALGWLLRIARNLVIDRQRKYTRYPIVDISVETMLSTSNDDTPENQVIEKEQYQLIMKMIETLSKQQREIVILRYIVGWRVKEIAQYLHIPENTVSVIMRRVLIKLSEQQE